MNFPRLFREYSGRFLLTFGILLATTTLWAEDSVVTVRIENLSPPNGTFLTPVWFGIHDGSFDLFDVGTAATAGLESLAGGCPKLS